MALLTTENEINVITELSDLMAGWLSTPGISSTT